MLLSRKWKWQVTGYYADDVKAPKVAGDLALQTVHVDDFSKDLEVSTFEKREDIGRIEVVQLRD